ncbi:cyclic nucleotide-binding domain protein (macronuclear) [Tetrahymena thermophila SB210]|uniref:Cyclic nucleotide-binding domain protein n=1 Tax=Tetrahymena thermophila (strain SB210) TaxID=312017 RepID=I7LVC8_TETTS|nr:cyclic nucleotide-binding domain protein [Tetrahymena thermophila SB210]EAR97883.2 cyclic nucleotide-binding domain protein [Tetrahymena thermophila SB210]|eukprot:XP_001018128.2 cyclic nucleotide-binding domain protein [Tetrahymena thermophila SB210]
MNEKVIKSIQECQSYSAGETLPEQPFREVFNYLEQLDHFKKIKKLPNYFELMRLSIRSLNLQIFKRGEILVRQRDRGDKFFIILSGDVNVYVQHSTQTLKKMNAITKKVNLLQQQENVVNQEAIKELDYQFRLLQDVQQEDKELLQLTNDPMFVKYSSSQLQLLQIQQKQVQNNQKNEYSISQEAQKFFCKRVNQLKTNCTFGEFSLAKLGQRTASIIAKSQEVVTAWIPYELYNIIFDVEIKFRENFAKFIQQFFPKIGDTFGVQIAYFFQEKPLLRNQVVYREGDQVNELFYILEGNITLTKRLLSQESQESQSQDLTQTVREHQISQFKKKFEEKTIVILQQNQFFGYEQENAQHFFTAVCSATNTKIYKLNKYLLNQISDYNFHDILHKKSSESIKRYNERINFISQTQLNINQVLSSSTNKQSLPPQNNPFVEYQLDEKNSPLNQISLLRNSINQIALKKYHLKSKSIVSLNNSPHQSTTSLFQSPQSNDNKSLTERASAEFQRKSPLHLQNQNIINLKPIENNSYTNHNSSSVANISTTNLNNHSNCNLKTEVADEYAPKSEIFEYAETFSQVKKRLKLNKTKMLKKEQLPQFGNISHLNKLKQKLSISRLFSQKEEIQQTQKLCFQQSLPELSDENMLFGQNENFSIRNIPSLRFITESHVFSMNHTSPSSPTTLNSQNLLRSSVHEAQVEQTPQQNAYQIMSSNTQYPPIYQQLNYQEQQEEQISPKLNTKSNNQQQSSLLSTQKIPFENSINVSSVPRYSLETQDSSNNTSEINIFKSEKLQRGQSHSNLVSSLSISTPLQLSNKQSPMKGISQTQYQQLQKSNTITNDGKFSLYPVLTNNKFIQQVQQQQQQNIIQSQKFFKQNTSNQNTNSNEGFSIRKKVIQTYTTNQAKQNIKASQNTQNTEEISSISQQTNEEELSIAQKNMIKSITKLGEELLFDDNTTTSGMRISSPMKSIEEEKMKEDLSFFSEENIKLNTEPNYVHQRNATQHEEPIYKDKSYSPNFLSRRNKKFYSLKIIKSQVNQKINETDIPNNVQPQQSLYFFSSQCHPTNFKNLPQQKNENSNSSKSIDKKKMHFESPTRYEKLSTDLKPSIVISPAIKGLKSDTKLSKLPQSPISQRSSKSIEKLISLNQVEASSNSNYSSDQKLEQPHLHSQETLKYQVSQPVKHQQEIIDYQSTDKELNEYRNSVTSTEFSYPKQIYIVNRPTKLCPNDQSLSQKNELSPLSPKNKINLKSYEYQTSDEAYFTNICKEDLAQNDQFKIMLQPSSDFLLKKQKGYKETLRNYYNLHKQLKKSGKSSTSLKFEQKLLPLQLNQCITPKQEYLEQTCRNTQKNRIQIALSSTSRNNAKSSSLDSLNNLTSFQLANFSTNLKKLKKQNENQKNIHLVQKEQYTDSNYPLRISKINIFKEEPNTYQKQSIS